MRLAESIETHGYFWLPEQPQNRHSGILRVSLKGEASLELFGSFNPSYLAFVPLPQPVILGVTTASGAVTLTDCAVTKQSTTMNIETLSKTDISVGWVFWRRHFSTEELPSQLFHSQLKVLMNGFHFIILSFRMVGILRANHG